MIRLKIERQESRIWHNVLQRIYPRLARKKFNTEYHLGWNVFLWCVLLIKYIHLCKKDIISGSFLKINDNSNKQAKHVQMIQQYIIQHKSHLHLEFLIFRYTDLIHNSNNRCALSFLLDASTLQNIVCQVEPEVFA